MQNDSSPLSADHYRGLYQLHEPVTRGKHRVDVAKFADPAGDISGGREGPPGRPEMMFALSLSASKVVGRMMPVK
jgi:hypothetical protein